MSGEFEFLLHQIEGKLTDGVIEAENFIKAQHGKIDRFKITVSKKAWKRSELLRDSIDFLCVEWDYKMNPLTDVAD